VTQLASEDVVQETSWTDEDLGDFNYWQGHLVAHLSTMGDDLKITSTAPGRSKPTSEELGTINLTFVDMSKAEAHRKPETGSLTQVATALAEGFREQMRSNGSVSAHFKLGSDDGITDFHPLYQSLSITVTDLKGENTPSTRSLWSVSEESN
jgi:hypothetical protein